MWNRLLTVLDQTLGFQNKITSNVVKKWQGFDNQTQEHVVQLEYRVKTKANELNLKHSHSSYDAKLIRELLRHLQIKQSRRM